MIELDEKILKGGWCDIYGVKGRPELCAKVLAPHRKYKGEYPDPNEIVREKYGIQDLLEYELANYRKILRHTPDHLRRYLVRIDGIKQCTDGSRALVMEKVLDDRGNLAPSLAKNKRPLAPAFKDCLEQLRSKIFIPHAIDHFGILKRNILVKSPEHPVLIDFQEGRERYRGQFWLRFPFFVRKKVTRCFEKLYKEIIFTTIK